MSVLIATAVSSMSCKKYLDEKADSSRSIPSSLDDLQALFDGGMVSKFDPQLLSIGSDEYYMNEPLLLPYGQLTIDAYTWFAQTFQKDGSVDWSTLYRAVFYANTVLDNMEAIRSGADLKKAADIQGQALFHRARTFYNIAQVYAPAYDQATANRELGIPLRLSSDFNVPTMRATVEQTYSQIIHDLTQSLSLLDAGRLPDNRLNKTRANRPAAFAMLARTFLVMGQFQQAADWADSCLKYYHTLIDFNSLNAAASRPIPAFNEEVIFHADRSIMSGTANARIDSALITLYDHADRRRSVFFATVAGGAYTYKGSYFGSTNLFLGLATDEVYLIKAEAETRLGHTEKALSALNDLLEKRWVTGSYTPVAESDPEKLLPIILNERRKELIMRGTRWTDLRRLNKDPRFAVELKRWLNVSDQTFTLPPNDLRYTWLIPQDVITMTGIAQNKR
jgi:tetratricopeptide (TPR) repeat protein